MLQFITVHRAAQPFHPNENDAIEALSHILKPITKVQACRTDACPNWTSGGKELG
jgi:hypothetical protein